MLSYSPTHRRKRNLQRDDPKGDLFAPLKTLCRPNPSTACSRVEQILAFSLTDRGQEGGSFERGYLWARRKQFHGPSRCPCRTATLETVDRWSRDRGRNRRQSRLRAPSRHWPTKCQRRNSASIHRRLRSFERH